MKHPSGGRPCSDFRMQPVRETEGTTSRTPALTSPAQKLAELCDADLRTTDREIRLLAAAVPAGGPMPDPVSARESFQSVMGAAYRHLRTQPSARSVQAAGQRLQRALVGVIGDVAKEVGE